ncbi:S8 family peptidase [Natronocalculus amylovorans]|uniref:S8 family serine peptidase n=1 Tax=Natronocalculus amylovorans TaxID=2917812 RepID=A0AAE3KAG9_9EURY|nr:S8 family serine peptidase [Natronocalculus amylovorans]MCL9818320.1 S8 family serine peptidase [Natronocalculus amylovorans]
MRLSRRSFLKSVPATIAAATLPTPAHSSGVFTELATTYQPLFGSGVGRDRAIEYTSDTLPSWHVVYAEDKRDSLETWIDNRDSRSVLSEHEPTRTATIVASPADVGAGTLDRLRGQGLGGMSWIEAIDLNVQMGLVEPITRLDDRDDTDELLSVDRFERTLLRIQDAGVPSPQGVAFAEEAPETTPAQVRRLLGFDYVSVDDSTVTIAVIDSGCNTVDGDVFGNTDRILPASKNFVSGGTVESEGLGVLGDPNGHGSFVASQIAANPSDNTFQGIASNCDLLICRALGDDGSGSTRDIIDAVTYAADHDADVICMSLGSPIYSAALDRALAYAVGAGSIPVVAVGNDRQATRWVASPASSEWAIGVGALTAEDPDDAQSAYFSNIGPQPGTTDLSNGETADARPDVGAPGMEMRALVGRTTGSTREQVLSGTSMAAPIVAGTVGLLIASDSAYRGDLNAIRDRLESHSIALPNVAQNETGAGMINAEALLTGSETDGQADSMTDEAALRNEAYAALSNNQGGLLTQLF